MPLAVFVVNQLLTREALTATIQRIYKQNLCNQYFAATNPRKPHIPKIALYRGEGAPLGGSTGKVQELTALLPA